MFKSFVAALTATVAFSLPMATFAAAETSSNSPVSTTFAVDANVVPNCTMQGGGFHFGNYDPLVKNKSTAITQYAAVFATCTKGTNASLVSPAVDQKMAGPGDATLAYTLNFGSVYGGEGFSGDPFSDPSLWSINRTFALNYIGSIRAGQDVTVGQYSASPVVTINF